MIGSVGGSYGAEAIKLLRRPSTWVLAGLWLAVVIVVLYLLPFVVVSLGDQPSGGGTGIGAAPFLLPENAVSFMLGSVFPYLGPAVALILGALFAGSEYGWGTVKTILSQRPSRLAVLSGKLLALATFLAALAAAAILAGLLCGTLVALILGAPVALPSLGDLVGGPGAGFLALLMWASLGFALATLMRGSTLAVGLGLIYAYPTETVLGLALLFNENTRSILRFLPGQNANAVAFAFSASPNPLAEQALFSPPYAALVLLLYTAAFLGLAALVFVRRDVT